MLPMSDTPRAEADPGVHSLLGVGRTVADLPAAIAFYRDALGFALVDEIRAAGRDEERLFGAGPARRAWLALGAQRLQLVAFDAPGRPMPADGSCADLWFQHIAVVSMRIEAAWRRLSGHATTPITRDTPQHLPAGAGGVTAFKFRDPEGHPVELIHFPGGWRPGPGAPVEARFDTGRITAGMDHSAISVADADRSVAFYTDVLHLRATGRQINRGIEQARLDDLCEPLVDVVALVPTQRATPHVELLGYRNPRGRSAAPARVSDLVSDRLIFGVRGLPTLLAAIGEAGGAMCLPGSVSLAGGGYAALVRDPDGHLLELREEAPTAGLDSKRQPDVYAATAPDSSHAGNTRPRPDSSHIGKD